METNLQALLAEIRELEKSVSEQLKKRESELLYDIKNRTVIFKSDVAEKHKALRKSIYRFLTDARIMSYVVAPVIYSMIIPAVIFQWPCRIHSRDSLTHGTVFLPNTTCAQYKRATCKTCSISGLW